MTDDPDSSDRRRPTIGCVPFGVGRPLVHAIHDDDADVVLAPPRKLVAMLREGSLDAALVSSIEGFRQPGYRALNDLGIWADGRVGSVRAFRRKNCARIDTVGLDDGSETSVALTRILLRRDAFGPARADAAIDRIDPQEPLDARSEDLVLLIGDAGQTARSDHYAPFDLGELWTEWTGLPFTFALWLIRPDVDARPIADLLRRAGRAAPEPPSDTGVRYDLGPSALEGLQRFALEAARLDLCEAGLRPELI